MTNPTTQDLIAQGALFVVNHSGGKDSQAMMIKLLEQGIPAAQMLVVHASLGRVEWHGALELAEQQARDAGAPFVVARAIWADGSSKDFLGMAAKRFADRPEVPSFASSAQRQCTSDLKRGPITKQTLAYAKAHGFKLIVNCEGIRGAESPKRSKLVAFEQLPKTHALAKAGRTAFSWLPIFDLTTAEVFATIADAGQEPHYAYAQGNERLSCVFCIMGSAGDIVRGALARPELFAEYVAMEERTGYTMHMNRKSLTQIVAEASLAVAA
jgi:3'-phosphoadenosine 5'-phosphosulfate sulfotransferase (PAPS reductase)/FAD synthetase